MPIKKNSGESKDDFISRCMSDEASAFPDEKQRYAVCAGYWTDAAVSDSIPTMINFVDRSPIGRVERTKEGYIATVAKAVRVGVQDYGAWESPEWLALAEAVGKGERDIIRVYRPPESVFSKDSLSSATHIPVTINHPPEMVDAANWEKYAVGETSTDALRDGEMVAFSIMVKGKRGVEAIDSGMVELSAGYVADLNIADAGLEYDYVMGPPDYNHLALVPRGRAGSQARIGDAQTWGASPLQLEDKQMTIDVVKVVFGDKNVSVEAKDADTVLAILKDHQTALDAKVAEIAVKDARIKELEDAKLTDEQIEAIVEEKNGKKKKREEVEAKIGDKAKDFTDEQIAVAHSLLDQFVDNTVRKALGANVRDANVTDGIAVWDAIYPKKGA